MPTVLVAGLGMSVLTAGEARSASSGTPGAEGPGACALYAMLYAHTYTR